VRDFLYSGGYKHGLKLISLSQLGRKPVVTEDQIERMVERQAKENDAGRTVRRTTRKRATGDI
jgi:hypothetical protein